MKMGGYLLHGTLHSRMINILASILINLRQLHLHSTLKIDNIRVKENLILRLLFFFKINLYRHLRLFV